jgi:hypothetical protein
MLERPMPKKALKLPPAVLKFFQETGSVGGKIGGKSTSGRETKRLSGKWQGSSSPSAGRKS